MNLFYKKMISHRMPEGENRRHAHLKTLPEKKKKKSLTAFVCSLAVSLYYHLVKLDRHKESLA
jgi:hypothetical protein